jgi:hypothetical protein
MRRLSARAEAITEILEQDEGPSALEIAAFW